jgi:DedD protein
MPRLNLKEDPFEGDITQDSSDRDVNAPPSLRDVGGGGGVSPLLLIIIILVVLAGGAFLLNHFGVVHLWGPKTTQLAGQLPEGDLPPPDWAAGEESEPAETTQDPLLAPSTELPPPGATPEVRPPVKAQQTPAPAVTPPKSSQPATSTPPPPSIVRSGTGSYTIQVSAWMTKQKAEAEAAKLSAAGYTAFVEDAYVGGGSWYRVRVGRYTTMEEAQQAAAQLQPIMESPPWVARVKR